MAIVTRLSPMMHVWRLLPELPDVSYGLATPG